MVGGVSTGRYISPKPKNTTSNMGDTFCKDCGWRVVEAVCNDDFPDFKDAINWDWWWYCSNKGCKNHDGEGVGQGTPEWADNVDTGRKEGPDDRTEDPYEH